MMATSKRERMYERIQRHGENLLRIFPNAKINDPIKLSKALRRLEAQGQAYALRLCNGPEFASDDDAWAVKERILTKVQILLGYATGEVSVFLNSDPRGYALKIDDAWLNSQRENWDRMIAKKGKRAIGAAYWALLGLHRDWGGYGILAPDFSNES